MPSFKIDGKESRRVALRLLYGFFEDMYNRGIYNNVKLEADYQLLSRKTQAEGLTVLASILPEHGAIYDRSLQGITRCASVKGFKRSFLSELRRRTHDGNGYLLTNPCIQSIKDMRQLCQMFKKLEVPYSAVQTDKAVKEFVETDTNIPALPLRDPDALSAMVVARACIQKALQGLNLFNIQGHHGPGSVAEGIPQWDKCAWTSMSISLRTYYPPEKYFFLTDSMEYPLRDQWKRYQNLETTPVALALMAFVPKTFDKIRIINEESTPNMWIQQGQKEALYRNAESWRNRYLFRHVNFTNQNINRKLALDGSKSGKIITLDLSKASDTVGLDHIKFVFGGVERTVLLPLLASRSNGVILPNGDVHHYRKFAPMGSATCFPIEALYFWALGVAVSHLTSGDPLWTCSRRIWVYGDDIVTVPQYGEAIAEYFPKFGLKLNEDKCCTAGKFRESCGMDAFDGIDVTPVRVKRFVGITGEDPQTLLSSIGFQNNSAYVNPSLARTARTLCQLRAYGLPRLSVYDDFEPGYLHYRDTSPGQWFHRKTKFRWNEHLQRYEFRALSAGPDGVGLCHLEQWLDVQASLGRLATTGKDGNVYLQDNALRQQQVWEARYTTRFKYNWFELPGEAFTLIDG